MDFGEGAGWQDVTSESDEWYVTLQGSPHTYAKAGTYKLRGRVTYLDGEIYYTDEPNELFTPRPYVIVLTE